MPAGGRAAVLTHWAPACAAAAAAVCAVVALAHCVLRIADASHAIHAGTFPRYGYCEYHFFWPRLGALGELIVQSHLRSETPERAWERWLVSSTAAAASIPARGRTFRGFGRYARARLGRAALSVSDARRTLRASSVVAMWATDTAATRRAASTIGAITTGASLGMCPAMQRCAAGQGSAHARCDCGRGAGTCGAEAVVKSCGNVLPARRVWWHWFLFGFLAGLCSRVPPRDAKSAHLRAWRRARVFQSREMP